MIIIEVCPICHTEYALGYHGVTEGCDRCLGIQRDKLGRAWFPNQLTRTFLSDDGNEFTVTRAEAFA